MVKKRDTDLVEAAIAEEKSVKQQEEAAITEKSKPKAAEAEKKVFVYLGPTVKGVITNGRIFGGTKEEILKTVAESAEAVGLGKKMAKIARLIVADNEISSVKRQLEAGDNGISLAYSAILAYEEEM